MPAPPLTTMLPVLTDVLGVCALNTILPVNVSPAIFDLNKICALAEVTFACTPAIAIDCTAAFANVLPSRLIIAALVARAPFCSSIVSA